MKRRVGLVSTCVIGAVLSGAAGASTGALAQTATTTNSVPTSTDAFAQADPVPFWWFHGTIEAGGRVFLNNPQRNGQTYLGQNSLAKYYEYSTIKPGPFGNIELATGSKDGLYQVDFGGKNIGYSDQNYYLDMSKAGEHYLSLSWDETPHLYSTSAQTPWLGVGTNALTLPTGCASNKNATAATVTSANCLQPTTDVGIKRETASAQYRWTPTDAWDVKADLSHLRRTGTQIDGVVGMGPAGFPYGPNQVINPVADTTQNYGLNGEYAGTSSWGKFNFKAGYKGSTYSDDYAAYTIQNPYCTGNTCEVAALSPFAQLSLPPGNQMNSVYGTLGADLPWKSRYAGTVSYTKMTQNAAFIPMTNNPSAAAVLNVLPASSLNGDINTVLSNNVVTTKITPDITSKLNYRYYNFQNNTPEILFGTPGSTTGWTSYDQNTAAERAIRSLSISYTKQNAGEELVWRPTRQWNLGVAYGYERYNYTRVDATSTDENSGKVFADWKPTSWVTLRSSGYYSDRTANNYNYVLNVGSIQNAGSTQAQNSFYYNSAYQQMMIDNRQRWKANFAVDLVVARGLTITPTFKYQDDYYGLNPTTQLGLTDSRGWGAGIDATYLVSPDMSVMVGYMYEKYAQLLYNSSSTSNTAVMNVAGVFLVQTDDLTTVNTFTAGTRFTAIPNKLDFDLRYTTARGVDQQRLNLATGAAPANGQFPDDTTWFQRFDAVSTYKFDPAQVAQLGWKGDVKAKLRYTWERNSVSNWQNDPLAPYSPVVSTQGIWLASNNPNYNVHLLMASLAYTW
jgi:MtrB/PioB family decaheme-associated outer membrane protein